MAGPLSGASRAANAGGAAAELDSLAEVARVASKAGDNIRSIGVAVSAGSIPETGKPTFELADDEIEVGMGAHGEPGVLRQRCSRPTWLPTR